jgi:hypothetical protein
MKITQFIAIFLFVLAPSSFGEGCDAKSCYEPKSTNWATVIACINRCKYNYINEDNNETIKEMEAYRYPFQGVVKKYAGAPKKTCNTNPYASLLNANAGVPEQQDGGSDSGYDDYPDPGTLSFMDEDYNSSDYQNGDRAESQISSKMTKMLDAMKKNATKVCKVSAFNCKGTKEAKDPIAYCWRYVKMGLMAGGYSKGYPEGRYASDAGKALKKAGFENAINQYKSSSKAPPGAILVYEKTTSGNGTPGHIEVVDENGDVISDYQDKLPIDHPNNRLGLSKTRKLIGIYIEGQSI